MADKLTKYIQEQRANMDVEEPPEYILDKILETSFARQKQHTFWMWKAASVILLITSSILLYLLMQEPVNQSIDRTLADISTEFEPVENAYKASIQSLQVKLEIDKINRKDYAWIFEELEHLDQINDQLLEDIGENADQDKLVGMLIDYYEKKLKILKRLELEINRKNHEKRTDIAI